MELMSNELISNEEKDQIKKLVSLQMSKPTRIRLRKIINKPINKRKMPAVNELDSEASLKRREEINKDLHAEITYEEALEILGW